MRGVGYAEEVVRVNFFLSSARLVFDGVITCLAFGANELRVVILPRLLGNPCLLLSEVVIKLILLYILPCRVVPREGEMLFGYVCMRRTLLLVGTNAAAPLDDYVLKLKLMLYCICIGFLICTNSNRYLSQTGRLGEKHFRAISFKSRSNYI